MAGLVAMVVVVVVVVVVVMDGRCDEEKQHGWWCVILFFFGGSGGLVTCLSLSTAREGDGRKRGQKFRAWWRKVRPAYKYATSCALFFFLSLCGPRWLLVLSFLSSPKQAAL
jgi:hypothetical protein